MKKEKIIWSDSLILNKYPVLDKDIETDILVIGGGICGILTAYKLKNEGYKVVLVEKDRIGNKITLKTTAFVSCLHDIRYSKLVNDIGLEKTKLYLEANISAVNEYEKLSKIYNFDYEKVNACLYSEKDSDVIKKEYEALKKLDYEVKLLNEIELPIKIKKALQVNNQGQMNALKLINCLSKEIKIYENTEIIEVKNRIAKTKNNKITASKIIICTHFPIYNNLLYSMKMYQNRSYVIAIKTSKELNSTYISAEEGELYFRKYKDYLLIGGNDIRTGKFNNCYQKLEDFVKRNYPNSKVEYKWANQDLVSLDQIPYIGKINSLNNNIYVATGFNLWGMTTSMISANIMVSLIKNSKSKYEDLYNPNRSIIKKQLLVNMVELLKNQIGFKEKRCTHLKCGLKYNECENSWDCSCHGSRYSINGEVLNDPAIKDLNM